MNLWGEGAAPLLWLLLLLLATAEEGLAAEGEDSAAMACLRASIMERRTSAEVSLTLRRSRALTERAMRLSFSMEGGRCCQWAEWLRVTVSGKK